jgi:hypothetical protein
MTITPQLANRILIVAIAIFVVAMIARAIATLPGGTPAARRRHDEAVARFRKSLERFMQGGSE